MKRFFTSWKTTSAAIVVVVIWVVKITGAIEIPTEVASALTVILTSVGLFFAADADAQQAPK